MTPLEQKQFLAEIGRIIDRKLEPIVERIERLEVVDTHHENGIREAHRQVVASKSEIVANTNDILLAAARHNAHAMESLDHKIEEIKEAARTSIAPAALGAERASHRIEGKTDALGKEFRWQKLVTGLIALSSIIEWISRALPHGGP